MSKTEIDYLFQAIAPSSERSPTALRSGGDSTGFDNHLNQASASVFDVVRMRSRSNPLPTISKVDDRQSRTQYESSPNGTSISSSQSQNPPQDQNGRVLGPPPNSTEPCEQADESGCSATDAADGDRDKDSADDELAEIGAATQVTSTQATTATVAQDGDAAEQAADEAHAQDLAELTSEQTEKSSKGSGEKDAKAVTAKEAAKVVAAGDESVGETMADTIEDSSTAAESNPSADKLKREKHTESTNANVANHAAQGEQQPRKGKTLMDAESSTTGGANLKLPDQGEAKSDIAASSAEAPESGSSDEEPQLGRRSTDRSDSGNGTPTTVAAKAEGAPIVADVAANLTDSTTISEAKTDAGDKAVKPVAAKTETSIGPLGRAMRAVTDITRGDQTANTDPTPQVDPARFVNRVTKAFQTAHERGGTLQLRLNPPELGAMKIQLNVKDGVMSASLETENANARRVLLDHLPALRERLAEQNIRVDRFDVDVKQENNGGQANPQGSNRNPYQQQSDKSEPRRPAAPQVRVSEVSPADLPTAAARISSTGINLVV